ncbi:MFS transporter [Rhodobacter lacus]|uniref:MFS transporter n=1 Tax=Rhodobacter lacus TaxID=1641972 RepID=A0ABW5A8V2_9RHOB
MPEAEAKTAPAVAPDQPPAAAPTGLLKPPLLALCYMGTSVIIALTQGLGMSLISANATQISGVLGATSQEMTWLLAAYLAPTASLTLMVFKLRAQYGLRNFAEVAIAVFVAVAALQLFFADTLQSALVLRFLAGVTAAPLSSLAFLYMMDPLAPKLRLSLGVSVALTALFISTPVAGLLSPILLETGSMTTTYLLEMGLGMICFGLIYMLPLPSPPREKVLHWVDLVSYGFIATGLGSLAVVGYLGVSYWWVETPWLGWVLAGGLLCGLISVLMELNRKNPFIDVRWLTSPEMLHFAGVLLLFRLILSEQSAGAVGFFRAMGLQTEQLSGFYLVVLLSMIVAGATSAVIMRPDRHALLQGIALVLLAIGSMMCANVTVLTRPEQLYASQILIGFSSGLYLPPTMANGLIVTFRRGAHNLLSFVIVFLTTQRIGAIIGAALFNSLVTLREQYHSHAIVQRLSSVDPLVSERLSQYAGQLRSTITDPIIRSAEGVSLLGTAATRQANALAYGDAFFVSGCLALVALAALLFQEGRKRYKARRQAAVAAPTPA